MKNYTGQVSTKEIKSNWIEQTSIGKNFMTGRGSTYGTQSHTTVHSAMD
jgi:hypothetical protein